MTIILFFYIYLVFLVLFAFMSVIALYHILRFGEQNMVTLVMTFLYIGVTVVVLFLTIAQVTPIDWSTPIPFFDNLPFPIAA
jgi:hypothetical protein